MIGRRFVLLAVALTFQVAGAANLASGQTPWGGRRHLQADASVSASVAETPATTAAFSTAGGTATTSTSTGPSVPTPSDTYLSAEAGATFVPNGGKGSWDSGYDSGLIMVHATLMLDGEIVAWASKNKEMKDYESIIFYPQNNTHQDLLGKCGIGACENAFCSGMTTTANNDVLIFGAHPPDDLSAFRSYHHVPGGGEVTMSHMSSKRWYPTPCTLPDGKILVVGGVDDAIGGYHADDEQWLDNPTYEIYDPATGEFSGDQSGMEEQLGAAFPINTYPHVIVMPDGASVAVSSGNLLSLYNRTGDVTFSEGFKYPPRPTAPWSYPQTGMGLLLPLYPPYDTYYFLAAGGVSEDRAKPDTPATDAAQVIELTAGPDAEWRDVGPMPYARVLADMVYLCDGTIGIFGGSGRGIGGWDKTNSMLVEYKDGTSWYCDVDKDMKCSKSSDWVYPPVIFDPETGKWSEPGSLEEATRPRAYHSLAMLMPDCRVMAAGSDVTWDQTAEYFSPPYFELGPQPVITSAPTAFTPGETITVEYESEDPVVKALLLRTGSHTHSLMFDARALWLTIQSNADGTLVLETPDYSKIPPGMYMLTLNSDKGVPSATKIMHTLGNTAEEAVDTSEEEE